MARESNLRSVCFSLSPGLCKTFQNESNSHVYLGINIIWAGQIEDVNLCSCNKKTHTHKATHCGFPIVIDV